MHENILVSEVAEEFIERYLGYGTNGLEEVVNEVQDKVVEGVQIGF